MVNLKSLLDAATDKKSFDPDVNAIFDSVDEFKKIKGVGKVKSALGDIRKKLLDSDQYCVCHAVEVVDFVTKNCSAEVHKEVLSSDFLNVMKSVIMDSGNDRAINRALELMAEWKSAFGDNSDYHAIKEVCSELDQRGFFMPQVKISAAAYAQKPPKWMEGQRCCLCRTEFSVIRGNRRHHCRNCGKSFCQNCSSKSVPLPKFGIDEPVRVCDLCYNAVKRGDTSGSQMAALDSGLPPEYLSSALAQESQVPTSTKATTTTTKSDDLKEQEELELALAMSLNDQENKKAKTTSSSNSYSSPPSTNKAPPPAPAPQQPSLYSSITYNQIPEQEESPDLSKYMDRSFWEQRSQQNQQSRAVQPPTNQPMAPVPVVTPSVEGENPMLTSLRSTMDMFVARMQEVHASGRSIATDVSVQSMFQTLTSMHPSLLAAIEDKQQEKMKEEGVLRKLDEVKEARISLDAMRRQHKEKMKQQQEEMLMLARLQVEQKRALLQQLKDEESAYQDLLKKQRQDDLAFQHSLYYQRMQQSKEIEEQQRKNYEQQLFEKQFGGLSVQSGQPQSVVPPPSMQPQSYTQPQGLQSMQPPQSYTQPQGPQSMQPPQSYTQPQGLQSMQPPQSLTTTQPSYFPPPQSMQPQSFQSHNITEVYQPTSFQPQTDNITAFSQPYQQSQQQQFAQEPSTWQDLPPPSYPLGSTAPPGGTQQQFQMPSSLPQGAVPANSMSTQMQYGSEAQAPGGYPVYQQYNLPPPERPTSTSTQKSVELISFD